MENKPRSTHTQEPRGAATFAWVKLKKGQGMASPFVNKHLWPVLNARWRGVECTILTQLCQHRNISKQAILTQKQIWAWKSYLTRNWILQAIKKENIPQSQAIEAQGPQQEWQRWQNVQEDERGSAGDQEEEDDGDDGGDDDGDDHAPFSSCLGSHLSAMDSSSPCQLLLAIDSGAHSSLPPTRSSRQLPPSSGFVTFKRKALAFPSRSRIFEVFSSKSSWI